jgi:mono/diheme cytochrome c family protein
MKVGVYRIFAFTSLIFLGILAVSPLKNLFSDWRKCQEKYNELLSQQPMRTNKVLLGVKQIWVEDLGRIDRCVSCHLGLSETRLTGASEPFKPHPKIYHDYEKLGCTICHKGQGLATSAMDAMAGTEFWQEPVLPREYIESSCGSCHREQNVPNAEHLNIGRKMIVELNCTGCHVVDGFTRTFTPSLNGIGDKVNRQWLVDWLKDPYGTKWNSRMPDFILSEDDAQALADFLMTFREHPIKLEPVSSALVGDNFDDDLIELGKTRFREARCISCHTVDERGGHLASELGKIASKVRAQWLYNFLKNPQVMQPNIPMPQYGFSDSDLVAVTAYMIAELVDWERAETDTTKSTFDRFEKGLQLFSEFNCAGCHDLDYPKISRNMGPELTYMGSKPLYELPLWPDSQGVELSSYIFGKLENPRQFVGNLRMPKYDLAPDQIIDITVALLAQTKQTFPADYIIGQSEPHTAQLKGRFGDIVRKYSCLSCHVIDGTGYLLASDLSFEGSRVQAKWLQDYFRLPYTIRPILTERMPNLYLTDNEIKTLAEYFEMVLVNDTLDTIGIGLEDEELVSVGKELLHEKYGCRSCHQIGGAGGYVGPPLDKVGSRLAPGWIFSWILDPQKYLPDTLEPNAGLTEADARAITAYLMSLK